MNAGEVLSRRGPLTRYSLAVLAALAGVLIRPPLAPLAGSRGAFLTFFVATAVSAGYGGFGPGILTTLLSVVLVGFFVLPPRGSFHLNDPDDPAALVRFLIAGLVISYICNALIVARERARANE